MTHNDRIWTDDSLNSDIAQRIVAEWNRQDTDSLRDAISTALDEARRCLECRESAAEALEWVFAELDRRGGNVDHGFRRELSRRIEGR